MAAWHDELLIFDAREYVSQTFVNVITCRAAGRFLGSTDASVYVFVFFLMRGFQKQHNIAAL